MIPPKQERSDWRYYVAVLACPVALAVLVLASFFIDTGAVMCLR